MKKYLVLLSLLLLVGCKRTREDFFTTPEGNITVSRNVISGDSSEGGCFEDYYQPLVLVEDQDKENLIDHLNQLEYSKLKNINVNDTCGYLYKFGFGEEEISVISKNVNSLTLEVNGVIYEAIGDLSFLDDLVFVKLIMNEDLELSYSLQNDLDLFEVERELSLEEFNLLFDTFIEAMEDLGSYAYTDQVYKQSGEDMEKYLTRVVHMSSKNGRDAVVYSKKDYEGDVFYYDYYKGDYFYSYSSETGKNRYYDITDYMPGFYQVIKRADKMRITSGSSYHLLQLKDQNYLIEWVTPYGTTTEHKRFIIDGDSKRMIYFGQKEIDNANGRINEYMDTEFYNYTEADLSEPQWIKELKDEFEFSWVTHRSFEDGYELVEYNGTDSNVTIPGTYQGEPVRYIGENVFRNNTSLESLTLPKTLVSIYGSSLEGTTNLTEVHIEGGSGDRLYSRDGILYMKDEENDALTLAYVPQGRIKDVVINPDVTHIGIHSFVGVHGVKTITIEANSRLQDISTLFIYFELGDYQLKAIYVDEEQYNYFVNLFSKRNNELIHLIQVNLEV